MSRFLSGQLLQFLRDTLADAPETLGAADLFRKHAELTVDGFRTFRGDDDVFVFVNEKLVIDLGGVHGAQEATVDFDGKGDRSGRCEAVFVPLRDEAGAPVACDLLVEEGAEGVDGFVACTDDHEENGGRAEQAAPVRRPVDHQLLDADRDVDDPVAPFILANWAQSMLSQGRWEAAEAVAREAWEEAGLEGRVLPDPVGLYSYGKRIARNSLPVIAVVYAMEVTKVHATWPEARQRKRKWMSPTKAAGRLSDPELRRIVATFNPPKSRR